MGLQIGFISTRFSGTDGVSLEAKKWADVLGAAGHDCYWFAGQTDGDSNRNMTVSQAHFNHYKNLEINNQVFGTNGRSPSTTESIHQLRALLKTKLHQFIKRYHLDLLVVQNAVSIPMHVPLGLAITETVAETAIPTIAHHHDFAWERDRFARNGVSDFLHTAFPPKLPCIEHVVINSAAREELAHRHGLSSTLIPNVIDFSHRPQISRTARSFRAAHGFSDSDIIILQPTRIIQRKGIELAIDTLRQLKDDRYKLLVSHEAGDEGFHYAEWLEERARDQGVDLRFMTRPARNPWEEAPGDASDFSLWDMYAHSDFVTFPSRCEGFGNAFLEAVYFRKPILVNRYATFLRDIEPLDFDLVKVDGYVDGKSVRAVREILGSPDRRREIGLHNYRIASRHFSYEVLQSKLEGVLKNLFGPSMQLQPEDKYSGNVFDLDGKAVYPQTAAAL
jgi:glycosyltransferase involved in cell wall biosynthesis